MVYDYEDCRKKRPLVVSGELDLPAAEIWPILYDTVYLVRDLEEETDRKRAEESVILFHILLQKVDLDDEEETDWIFEGMERMLGAKIPPKDILGALEDAGVSLTEYRYQSGDLTTFRDFLLQERFSTELIDEMARRGVDLNKALVGGKTPAFLLAEKDRGLDEELVRAVEEYFSVESMEAVDKSGSTAAHWAARNCKYAMISAMLRKGVNVNLTEDAPQVAGTTLLHAACEYGCVDIIRLLMDAGADDTLMNVKEETAAHIAVDKELSYRGVKGEIRAEMIRTLKHVDIPGKEGMTPLMAAQDYDLRASDVLTPVFLEKGANVNRADNSGNTALLLHAYWYCDMDVIKAMVNAGYNLNAQNEDGDTVLHYAVENGQCEVVRYLLKKGADYNLSNENQVTPLQLAVEKGLEEVLPLMGV